MEFVICTIKNTKEEIVLFPRVDTVNTVLVKFIDETLMAHSHESSVEQPYKKLTETLKSPCDRNDALCPLVTLV